jgi:hypothetical protein
MNEIINILKKINITLFSWEFVGIILKLFPSYEGTTIIRLGRMVKGIDYEKEAHTCKKKL